MMLTLTQQAVLLILASSSIAAPSRTLSKRVMTLGSYASDMISLIPPSGCSTVCAPWQSDLQSCAALADPASQVTCACSQAIIMEMQDCEACLQGSGSIPGDQHNQAKPQHHDASHRWHHNLVLIHLHFSHYYLYNLIRNWNFSQPAINDDTDTSHKVNDRHDVCEGRYLDPSHFDESFRRLGHHGLSHDPKQRQATRWDVCRYRGRLGRAHRCCHWCVLLLPQLQEEGEEVVVGQVSRVGGG
ncbi:hypothetical protein T439DRAFT_251191 [Meredithblackwellia eburnea MCA 4105]